MNYTCSRCYRVLDRSNQDEYRYRIGDIEIRLCTNCFHWLDTSEMPHAIRKLAEQVGRRFSIERPTEFFVVDEQPTIHMIKPPHMSAWTRFKHRLERSVG